MTPKRQFLFGLASATIIAPAEVLALSPSVWNVRQAYEALKADEIRLIDVRSRGEWQETGVAKFAWPVSLHEPRFSKRLIVAKELAVDRPIALICASGGRSGRVLRGLKQAGFKNFLDVSEGMMGSNTGPGWIASGLPIQGMNEALSALPPELT